MQHSGEGEQWALCPLPREAEELTEETVKLMKYPKRPFHRNCAHVCSVQAMAGQGELLAAPGLDLPQDTSKLLLPCLCQGGREGGQKVFWLCTALSKQQHLPDSDHLPGNRCNLWPRR